MMAMTIMLLIDTDVNLSRRSDREEMSLPMQLLTVTFNGASIRVTMYRGALLRPFYLCQTSKKCLNFDSVNFKSN